MVSEEQSRIVIVVAVQRTWSDMLDLRGSYHNSRVNFPLFLATLPLVAACDCVALH